MARENRLQQTHWEEIRSILKLELERNRHVVYNSSMIAFNSFIDIYLYSKKKFPNVCAFGFCGFVGEDILSVLSSNSNRITFYAEDFDNVPEKLEEYASDLVHQIVTVLTEVGYIGIHINNNYLDHYFVLCNTTEGVFRIESYSGNYITRIISWDSYDEDLYKLVTYQPSAERLSYWDGLFNVNVIEKEKDKFLFTVKLIL